MQPINIYNNIQNNEIVPPARYIFNNFIFRVGVGMVVSSWSEAMGSVLIEVIFRTVPFLGSGLFIQLTFYVFGNFKMTNNKPRQITNYKTVQNQRSIRLLIDFYSQIKMTILSNQWLRCAPRAAWRLHIRDSNLRSVFFKIWNLVKPYHYIRLCNSQYLIERKI